MYARESDLRAMLRRAQLLSLDDSGAQQLLNLSGFVSDRPRKVPHVQPFGFSSAPPAGADFILMALGAGGSRTVALGGEHQSFRQANTPAGSAVLYDSSGNVVFAKSASGIVIKAKDGAIVVQPADGQNVFLGGDGTDGTYEPIKTATGVALNVMAKIA
jgi:phage gp45-like